MFEDVTQLFLVTYKFFIFLLGVIAVDPVAAYEYQRVGYKFHENDLIFPVPGDADRVAHYDKFGVPGGK